MSQNQVLGNHHRTAERLQSSSLQCRHAQLQAPDSGNEVMALVMHVRTHVKHACSAKTAGWSSQHQADALQG